MYLESNFEFVNAKRNLMQTEGVGLDKNRVLHSCGEPKTLQKLPLEELEKHWSSQESGKYGPAITRCYEDITGKFWVTNDEYSSRVAFCPFCGTTKALSNESFLRVRK